MRELKDRHKGETAWIIGKGLSLRFLKKSDFGEGPVIAIYEALIPIETMRLPNPLYSLQKDGGRLKKRLHQMDAECDHQTECDFCEWVVRPLTATLLLHELEARHCFKDYSPRYTFTLDEIGMQENQFSLACAIKIAQYMGCDKVRFVSCDVHATGATGNIVPLFDQSYYDWIYGEQKKILPKYLEGVDCEWVTPEST